MSANSSSNVSLLPLPSPTSFNIIDMNCFIQKPTSYIYFTFLITYVLLILPLCVYILSHGFHDWQKRCSTSSVASTSHIDGFTYHMAIMELITVTGQIVFLCTTNKETFMVVFLSSNLSWYGQIFFNILICLERYLAAVHPITYLSLKNDRGIRMRDVSIGCVWLLALAGVALTYKGILVVILNLGLLTLSLSVISFCSLSVLRVLTHPRPGDRPGSRLRPDQSKLRAFYTIVAILGVLVLRFTWGLAWCGLLAFGQIGCTISTIGPWFNLPSSLVLPLLFLQGTGKCLCCKYK